MSTSAATPINAARLRLMRALSPAISMVDEAQVASAIGAAGMRERVSRYLRRHGVGNGFPLATMLESDGRWLTTESEVARVRDVALQAMTDLLEDPTRFGAVLVDPDPSADDVDIVDRVLDGARRLRRR